MTFEQYWVTMVKRWYIILACFLAVGLGALIGSKLMKPLYQSSTFIQVVFHSSNIQSDYNSLLASDQLVQTEATLAVGDPVLREVASHYSGLTVKQLEGEVSSSIKLNTQLFEIDVVDQSPFRAADLANDIALTLIKQQAQANQQDNAQSQQQIQQNIDQINQQMKDISTKIAALQAKGANQDQIAPLQTQLSGLQQRNTQWQTALAQLELTQAQDGNPLRVVQVAQPSTNPVRPNILLYTGIGFLVGLLFGVLLAILYELLDTRIRTPEEISRVLSWPVLTSIWRVKTLKPENLINPVSKDINVEPYRILRTNIGFASLDKPLHSLIVTSAQPNDGKSVIAANLAIFMAKAGKSTLLIDADLHRPTQHILFNLPSDRLGLSNAILAFSMPNVPSTPSNRQFFFVNTTPSLPPNEPVTISHSLERFVHSVGITNLWIMPSGPLPPNPSEMFESKVMQRFLTVLANCGIEIVIFDTPPLLGLSDASILASKVDGAVVVVDTSRVTKEKLKQTKVVLAQTGVQVLGCVANKLKHKRNDTSYYYYSADEYSTEKPVGNGQNGHNGHLPPVPTTPMIVEPPYDRRVSSN